MQVNSFESNLIPGSSGAFQPKTKSLGQDDFLQLLITQLTSQDPMNPQKDTDFIAQMAQFTSLEQTRNVWDEVSQLRAQQQFLNADSMIGRTVSIQPGGEEAIRGVVTAVAMEEGLPKIVVEGASYDLSEVLVVEASDFRH